MKKVTLFIFACTLVASNQTMLGAAGAIAMPASSPAENLLFAVNMAEADDVKTLLETYGAEAYATPVESPIGTLTVAELLSSDDLLQDHLKVIAETPGLSSEDKEMQRDLVIKAWEDVRKVWQEYQKSDEYQKSLSTLPSAVPTRSPR